MSRTPLAQILGTGRALPRHYYDQATLMAAFRQHWGTRHHNLDRLERLHTSVRVGGRHLALPMETYPELRTFSAKNAAFIEVGVELGEDAVRRAMAEAALPLESIDLLMFTSVTGVATPSIDARLVERLGLRPDVKRIPIFGLGCVAGAAGIARTADYLVGHPGQIAVLLSVELCSLTLQHDDLSLQNIIASGLFGDGAAAVVLGGPERPGPAAPKVVATRSVFYPRTERLMGWDVTDGGFKIVLSPEVPALVEREIAQDVQRFLADQGLSTDQLQNYVCHPGGPKVLESIQRALKLDDRALALTWKSLAEVGNLSSASVLFVLGDTMRGARPSPGSLGLLLAMGPGFCSELVLIEW
ncbi:MAG: 3-oxoacyl-[acyl-carrier-protein] synthase III C-terminal domain-containing protein [Myxococcota bacterium]